MKFASAPTPTLLLLVALVAAGAVGSGEARPNLPQFRRVQERINCITPILRSYLFKGRRVSTSNFKSLICPTLTRTCCNRFDEQRAYHILNDILPNRLAEYREKIKSGIVRVKLLRQTVLNRKPQFRGSQARQDFCYREFRRLDTFGWNNFQQKLVDELEHSYQALDDHYAAFYCILCDGNNHRSFVFRPTNQGFLVDSRFCNDFLEAHSQLLQLWNVEMMNLIINIQNVVDCFHYRRSFNLPFFDVEKQKQLENAGRCINSIGSKVFLPNCQQICNKVTYARVMDLLEGDFEFLTVAMNLLERYFRTPEMGRAVNNGLRSFFKSLTIHDRAHPESLGQLDVNFDTFRKGFDFDPGVNAESNRNVVRDEYLSDQDKPPTDDGPEFDHSVFRRKLVQRQSKKSGPARSIRIGKGLGKRRANRPLSRYLADYEAIQTQPEANQPSAFTLQNKRQLAARDQSGEEPTGPRAPPSARGVTIQNLSRPKRETPLVYSSELRNKYRLLHILPRSENATSIFEIEPKPMEFDKANRFYDQGNGINTYRYKVAATGSEREFYLKLFSYRTPEPPNSPMINFLSDFAPAFRVEVSKCLNENFKVDGRFWSHPVAEMNDKNTIESLYRKER